MIVAAAKGLEGAVRHFLREDPACVTKADGWCGEAWWVAERSSWRGLEAVEFR